MSKTINSNINTFQNIQQTFTQHLRDPKNNIPPEDIDDKRLNIYRELIYNNIEQFMANSFPVLRKIITDDDWHNMLRDYVAHHKSQTPLFPKMPQEFLHYLQHERTRHENDPAFLLELAHYEWIETSLAIDTRTISLASVNTEGDLLDGVPVLNCLVLPLTYQWPVHKISAIFQPQTIPEQASYILVYRDRQYQVSFIELNAVSAKLIELCLHNNAHSTGREMLMSIADQLQHPNPSIVIDNGLQMMQAFKTKDIILGTQKQEAERCK